MATAASLMVRIGADVEDFTRGMDRASKAANRGFKEIADAGKKMTEFVTLPLVAAAAEFTKLAADAQDASARVDRVFGSMSESVKGQLEAMTSVIPETLAGLEALAVRSDNMLQGFGFSADKAAGLSLEMVKLAGDMAAFAHVPIGDALDALDKGLAGKTRGLLQFGIAVNAQQIHLEALRRGLLDNGKQLTELGTAEIAESLIRQASTRITGEAERTAGEATNSFKFLKASAEEAATSLGTVLIPPVLKLTQGLKELTDGVAHADPVMQKIVVWGAGIAAAIGPTILLVARLGKEFVALQRAAALLAGGEGIAAIIGTIAAAPVATVLAAIAAITAALGGLYYIWQEFKKTDTTSALDNDPALAKFVAGMFGTSTPGGPLSVNAKSPFDQFSEQAGLMTSALDSAIQHGQSLTGIFNTANNLHEQALGFIQQQGGELTKNGAAAQKIADEMQRIKDIIALSNASVADGRTLLNQIGNRPIDAGAAGAASAVDAANKYRQDLATRGAASQYGVPFDATQEAVIKSRGDAASNANDLALRQALLDLPDSFDAAKTAAVQYGEEQRAATEQISLSFEKIKMGLGAFGSHLDGLSQGMQSVVVNMFDAVTNFAQQLAQQLGGRGRSAGLFGGLGSALGGAFAGAKLGIAFGPLGAAVGGIAGSLFGSLFDNATSNTTSALNTLGNTAQKVNEALTNLPQGFKIAYDRFLAETPQSSSGATGPSGPSGPGGLGPIGSPTGNIYIGTLHVLAADPASMVRQLQTAARASLSRGGPGLSLSVAR